MTYLDADTLTAEFPLSGGRTYLSTVEIEGLRPVTLAPVILPYSPEYKPADRRQKADLLTAIANPTGGQERIDVSGIWGDLPVKKQMISLTPWLVGLAVIAFLLEIFQRRTGLLSTLKWDIAIAEKARTVMGGRRKPFQPDKSKRMKAKTAEASREEDTKAAASAAGGEDKGELLDAMSRAQQKAQSRTKR
jgi:hypothetical protein